MDKQIKREYRHQLGTIVGMMGLSWTLKALAKIFADIAQQKAFKRGESKKNAIRRYRLLSAVAALLDEQQ